MKNRYLESENESSGLITGEQGLIFITKGSFEGELLLQWDAAESAQYYIVEISPSGSGKWKQVDIVKEPRYEMTGLKKGRKYSFRVASIFNTGQSQWSKVSSKKIK